MSDNLSGEKPRDSGPFAHIERAADGGWRLQFLTEHLRGTATLAREYAEPFGGGEWAHLAGVWHDLGKAQPAWQRYIRSTTGYEPGETKKGPPHSIVGAINAIDRLGDAGRLLAYVIGGHHAGLADWGSADGGDGALSIQLGRRDLLDATLATTALPTELLEASLPQGRIPGGAEEFLHVFVRMLFSCLVDADSIDTERFADPDRAARRSAWPTLAAIEARLKKHVAGLPREGAVNEVRWQVRDEVIAHAAEAPGFFSLTVPTGGGKTLTSLSFALAHARANRLRRVIYAIPYLSIIEQTAEVFRKAVGEGILEHHSNLDPDTESQDDRLAAEDWAAPLVVTTTVQLFESLFASKRGRCRKLHNIAGSVIVLDEAQLLPPDFLQPILSVLRALVAGYGCSVVLCTATQPALASHRHSNGQWFKGLDGVRELVRDPDGLHDQLERVVIEWPADHRTRLGWEDVAARLLAERQVLCVVNTRVDARTLSGLVPDSIHLSASMCAEHRAARLGEIERLLTERAEVRVVSTQLVEAGVDIDFPVVFRALSGLDSIAQCAGRCNREGLLDRGRTVVFVPPKQSPAGHLRQAEQATLSLLARADRSTLLAPDGFRRFFERLFGDKQTLDRESILQMLTADARELRMSFRSAATAFQLIDDRGTTAAIVPYGRGINLIAELERLAAVGVEPGVDLRRRLQRFTVTLRERELRALMASRGARQVAGIFTIDQYAYDEQVGVLVGDASIAGELVV
jgi:CRISPR-associated endonuclease/helicase Cas3